MLYALQTNSYQSNLNNAVSQAVAGTKPDLVTYEQKSEQATLAKKSPVGYHMSSGMESINKAIDEKIAEYFNKYPNGGSDQEAAQFLESVKFEGITAS